MEEEKIDTIIRNLYEMKRESEHFLEIAKTHKIQDIVIKHESRIELLTGLIKFIKGL